MNYLFYQSTIVQGKNALTDGWTAKTAHAHAEGIMLLNRRQIVIAMTARITIVMARSIFLTMAAGNVREHSLPVESILIAGYVTSTAVMERYSNMLTA